MGKAIIAVVLGAAAWACSDSEPPTGAGVVVPSAPPTGVATVTYFQGRYTATTQTLEVTYRARPGELEVAATLPYGTGSDQVDFHTLPGTVQWQGACGTSTLCANVQGRNHYGRTVTGLTAIFDTLVPADVTAVGAPYAYGTVLANGSSNTIVWSFSDPTNANFTFTGHADGVVAAQTGHATLSSAPTSVALGSVAIGEVGANGLNTGAAASVHSTTTDTSGTDATTALTVVKTGAAELVVGDGDCTGKTLQPGTTCTNGYVLDCRSSTGATVGSKSGSFAYTDPASGNSTTIAIAGACIAATTGGGILSITPRTHSYGNVELQNAVTSNFTVRNIGTTSTGALSAQITGATEFTLGGCAALAGGTLGVGQSCTLAVTLDCNTLAGATLGAKTASGTGTDAASGSQASVTVAGTCVCVATGNGCSQSSDCCSGSCDPALFACN